MYKKEVGRLHRTHGARHRNSRRTLRIGVSHAAKNIGHSWASMGHGGPRQANPHGDKPTDLPSSATICVVVARRALSSLRDPTGAAPAADPISEREAARGHVANVDASQGVRLTRSGNTLPINGGRQFRRPTDARQINIRMNTNMPRIGL